MKLKVLLLLFLLMLLGITVNAAEDRYIIKLNDSLQLYNVDSLKNNKDYLSVPADELQDFIDAGVVEYYEPDYKVELYGYTWNVYKVGAAFPHYIGCGGTDVRIGVIDSGIVEGVAHNVIPGYNYIDNNTDTSDTTMHGTWVSAIAASTTFGVAVNAQFVPLKCFKKDVDTYISDILDAVVDAVDVYDCDVINMSFGVEGTNVNIEENNQFRLFREKIDYAVEKGAIVVAAVGNDEDATINYPAAFENVIGVGSVDNEGSWSYFSNYNRSVHVVAPGEDVVAPYISDGEVSSEYCYLVDGTSFAAPHVSGLAAIAKCIDKNITQEEFKNLIAETAIETESDTVEGWDDHYGYGMINCEAAVKKLIEGQIMHISPIEKAGDIVDAVIYNNTADSRKVLCVYVCYDEEGRMIDCVPAEVEIDAYNIYEFPNLCPSGTVKYMVWSADNTLVPLAAVKEK